MSENEIATILVDIFIRVHSKLGPGLLESVYEAAICYELDKLGINYHRQKPIPVVYDEVYMELGFRADIVVEDKVIVEVKSTESIKPVFFKTLLSYLRLSDKRLGLIANFNVSLMKHGILRVANKL
jgi:GxxExxY protein